MITLLLIGMIFSIIGSIFIVTGKVVWFLTGGILKLMFYFGGAIFVLALLGLFLL